MLSDKEKEDVRIRLINSRPGEVIDVSNWDRAHAEYLSYLMTEPVVAKKVKRRTVGKCLECGRIRDYPLKFNNGVCIGLDSVCPICQKPVVDICSNLNQEETNAVSTTFFNIDFYDSKDYSRYIVKSIGDPVHCADIEEAKNTATELLKDPLARKACIYEKKIIAVAEEDFTRFKEIQYVRT